MINELTDLRFFTIAHLSAVKLANEKLSVPITCKIRVFTEMDKTVRYAQMLERAGCQVGLHHSSS